MRRATAFCVVAALTLLLSCAETSTSSSEEIVLSILLSTPLEYHRQDVATRALLFHTPSGHAYLFPLERPHDIAKPDTFIDIVPISPEADVFLRNAGDSCVRLRGRFFHYGPDFVGLGYAKSLIGMIQVEKIYSC